MLLCIFAGMSLTNLPAVEDERPVVDDSKAVADKAANATLPTLFVVGDSTLNSSAPMRGWGQELPPFFDPKKINVINRAIGGRSSRTYQAEGRWAKVLAEMKTNDIVLVQFGHNDVGRYDDPKAKFRPSLHGAGEETANVTKPDGTNEAVHTFGWYMRKYGGDARARGARVVFCSMVPHKRWEAGKISRSERESFVKWTAEAAKATGASFIDLNEMVALRYEKLGQEKVEPLFADKGTHTTMAGAQLNAECVLAGLRALPGAPFDSLLSDKGRGVTPAAASFVVGAP